MGCCTNRWVAWIESFADRSVVDDERPDCLRLSERSVEVGLHAVC